MKFLKNSKGFTLAEMLIVMAVVVVLAAAALPKIGTVLEGARESNDLSAIAAAYTEAYTKVAMAVADGTASGNDLTPTVANVEITQKTTGWNYITSAKVGGLDLTATGAFQPKADDTGLTNGKGTLKFTFTATATTGEDPLSAITLTKIEIVTS